MPMHDWTNIEAGIYHHFHHAWITAIGQTLNRGVLPPDYYALAEQVAAGFGPDVLTLQDVLHEGDSSGGGTATQTRPKTTFTAEASSFKPRRKSLVAVRHVSDDRVVAMIEIVSPNHKNSSKSYRAFVQKACELLEQRTHLLLLDPFPPSSRDPNGIHASIWSEYSDDAFELPHAKPLTFVAYESGDSLRAYLEALAVGETLPDMPLFLVPGTHVSVPLETTYQTAWDTVPARWQRVIEPPQHETKKD